MRRGGLAALVVGIVVAGSARAPADDEAGPIAVIVGTKSAIERVSYDDLRELYLRRRRVWPNGAPAIPVNLPASHPVRERFSVLVLGRSTQDLLSYWNARYFEGITPPAVLTSPAAIRAYVAVEPDAIGYVPLTDVDGTCRTLLVLNR